MIKRSKWLVAGVCLASASALADDGLTFVELDDPAVQAFERTGSTSQAIAEAIHRTATPESPLPLPALITGSPMMPRGLPGVSLFDFDNDGDLDIYATNGPGSANSLLSNQLRETGSASFVDVAASAGVEASAQDSFGVCFGDTDNDGDADLLVLGRNEAGIFFENNGDGTFDELDNGAATGDFSSTGCSMADFNGDGLLDIVVSNSYNQDSSDSIFGVPDLFSLNHANQLFVNTGDNIFSDASVSSGITNNAGFYDGRAGITWAVGSADVDGDGDIDVVFADDQGAVPPERVRDLYPPDFPLPIADRALVHVFLNDGEGHFTDHPITNTPYAASEWMGVTFGDLNCDGNMDLFLSTFGDYGNSALDLAYIPGSSTSRWFLGNGDGSFEDVGVGDLNATPFGWGSAIFDYDNDGDSDILYHGGLDAANILGITDNPGVLLENQACSANFVANTGAIQADHITRNVRGVAVGDLDQNGFVDVVTVANWRVNEATPLVPSSVSFDSPFDDTAFFAPILFPVHEPGTFPPMFVWGGVENDNGDLMVELNSGNHNRSANVRLRGSVGDVAGAVSNRDGIGALLRFTPRRGFTNTTPMVGGSSHSSQHATERVFGLGSRRRGTLEVQWQGGVRNRLYGVRAGERIEMPEIPCSIDTGERFGPYLGCVAHALHELRRERIITRRMKKRLLVSAIIAYFDR